MPVAPEPFRGRVRVEVWRYREPAVHEGYRVPIADRAIGSYDERREDRLI